MPTETKTDGQYKVVESTRHGKNVKGNKVTSTIQVQYHPTGLDYYLLKGQFRFRVGDAEGRLAAIDKAIAFAKDLRKATQC